MSLNVFGGVWDVQGEWEEQNRDKLMIIYEDWRGWGSSKCKRSWGPAGQAQIELGTPEFPSQCCHLSALTAQARHTLRASNKNGTPRAASPRPFGQDPRGVQGLKGGGFPLG